jgi:tripartite-type tricarboxylate transporter receptor subunit TctC
MKDTRQPPPPGIRRRHVILSAAGTAAALGCGALLPRAARADAYPSKPVVVKVAFPAGGPADVAIRASAVVLQRNLGQAVVAENLAGANGSIGAMNVLKASPDGYTLLGTTGTDFLLAPLTIGSAKYRPESFRLIGVVGISDFLLVSSPRLDLRSVGALKEYVRKEGRPLSIAHWGNGSTPHIVAADFQARTGIKLLEVPYKGAAPTLIDVSGGQVDLTFAPLGGPTLGMITSGRLRPIAIASPARNPALPDVPTIAESARVGSFDYSVWSALFALQHTPDAVVNRLNAAMNEWIASAENLQRITDNASRRLAPMTPAQATAFLNGENEKLTRVARSLKLSAA